ncbi:MAG: TIGR01244 family sulfur transferase [Telluria sp.]
MEIRKLDADVAIMGQPTTGALEGLKQAGFASMICNRPDDEAAGQPPFAEIAAEAARLGMQAHYLPVVPGKITPADGAAFAALLAELPKPILAYCRTGNRSETLWKLAQGG